jgi:hypothetical protein
VLRLECRSGSNLTSHSQVLWSAREAGFVQVFGRRNVEPIHALVGPASEKRQGTKSRWVGHWRCRGLYGELSGASSSKRMTRSGRAHGFGPRRRCRCGAERADRRFLDQNGAAVAGQSDGSTQAGALPVESRREWRVLLRWRIVSDGIIVGPLHCIPMIVKDN